MFKFYLTLALLFIFSFLTFTCTQETVTPEDGVNGFSALVNTEPESAGDNCSSGGIKITVGQDDNANGTLDESEIESTSYVCNGNNGSSTSIVLLVNTSEENPGENCEIGGTKIEIGADLNSDGQLGSDEIQSTFFVCNGVAGDNGSDGNNGSDGANGSSSITRVSTEEPGDNCSGGGLKIEVGTDTNNNGDLESEEIQSTYFVCNGNDGSNGTDGDDGFNTISKVTTELSGSNCINGGLKVEIGLDSNRNSVLDSDEVVSENYVCNGVNGTSGSNGSNGLSSITRVNSEASGDNCANGGLKVEIGMDDINVDGALQDEEVDYTYYVCNGIDGTNGTDGVNGSNGISSFIKSTTESSGANCANGGVKIELGLDANDNSLFDDGEEIGDPIYVCNGLDGTNGSDGSDGKSVIVVSTSTGASCSNGGTELQFGYDGNNDGDLEDAEDEILETITICTGLNGSDGTNGTNGINTIIVTRTEDPGDNCSNGGLAFQVGLDANGNNAIDDGEEVGIYYACNGLDGSDGSNGSNGRNSLIDVQSFSGIQGGCTDGGFIIRTGIDDNNNDILDIPAEVDATSYVCNGSDGSDGSNGSDGASDNIFEFYYSEEFDGYSGVRDASISSKNSPELGQSFSVDTLSGIDSHGLLYFPELERIKETVGTDVFEIVEAILYLRGVSARQDGTNDDNWIGVKNLRPNAPLFVEDDVSWTNANKSDVWTSPGAAVTEDKGAYDYSDMFRLPSNFQFNGYIPLLLNRSEVELWTQSADNNKGLVLSMVDNVPYQLDVYSSNYLADINFRPTLYIKVKLTSKSGRSERISNENYVKKWNAMSYEEKLLPLTKKNNN